MSGNARRFSGDEPQTPLPGHHLADEDQPETWRWQQHADWLREHKQIGVQNIQVSGELWSYPGNRQPKVARTNQPHEWHSDSILLPPRTERNRRASLPAICVSRRENRTDPAAVRRGTHLQAGNPAGH